MIPIKRPMDFRFIGQGQITITGFEVHGFGTCFLKQVKPNDHVVVYGEEYKVKKIIDDEQLELYSPSEHLEKQNFKIYPQVNNSECYDQVMKLLEKNLAFGLFPEGETHETPSLIQLKPGVATLILRYLENHKKIDVQCFAYVLTSTQKLRSKIELIIGEKFEFTKKFLKLSREDAIFLILNIVEKVGDM